MHEHRRTGVRRTGCKERLEKGSLLVKIQAVSISWGSAFTVSIHTSAADAFSICCRWLWSRQGIVACQQSSRYQPIPSKGSGRHVRDAIIQHDLCFISVFYSTSLAPQHAFFLLTYFLPNIATHNNTTHNSFIQSICGLVRTVQLAPVADAIVTHLAFNTWRKFTDVCLHLAARVWIHWLLFVVTGRW